MRSLFAAAIIGSASAALQCAFSDYSTVVENFALGFQQDNTDTTTDCYTSTSSLISQVEALVASFKNFSISDYLAPIYTAQETLVELTAVFSDCQTTNSALQLMTRTTTFAGLGDIAGVVGGGYLKYALTGASTFWDEITGISSAGDCASQVLAVTSVISQILNFKTPDEVFYEEVGFNMLDNIAV